MFDNADQLVEGHSLSFTSQTELTDVFKLLLDPGQRFTFVVGAGFSMNAGLPSWNQLLANIYPLLGNPSFEALARLDEDSATRRAEYLLRMAEAANPGDSKSIVRDALYRSVRSPTPGPLVESLASLAATLGTRARILTTNFDRLLEDALERLATTTKSYSLAELTAWESDASGPGDILHLHGLLEPNETPHTDIVLTESEFLEQGPLVRDVIRKRLETDVVVFLGVSLTDANLVGPLFDLAKPGPGHQSAHAPFLVVVPSERELVPSGPDFRDQMDFFIAKLKSIARSLAIKPIIMKSHSQVAQLLWELNLAATDTSAYRIGRGRKLTSTYGKRFTAQLAACYDKVGASRSSDFVSAPKSTTLANHMQAVLERSHPFGKAVADQMDRFTTPGTEPERLALFLWLRSRKHGRHHAPYSLTLVGTSSYVARHQWTLTAPQRISPVSKYAAVKAVFGGIVALQNLPEGPSRSVWKGVLGLPIRIRSGNELYTVGAISLNSTRYMIRESIPGAPVDPDDQLSFIAKLTSDQDFSNLITELELAAIKLIA